MKSHNLLKLKLSQFGGYSMKILQNHHARLLTDLVVTFCCTVDSVLATRVDIESPGVTKTDSRLGRSIELQDFYTQ